jgi:hypothetical protein
LAIGQLANTVLVALDEGLARQAAAFGAPASACKHILCLTGTLAGGYSSDVYHLLFRAHPQLMLEDNNAWGNPKSLIERYGVLEKITTVKGEDGLTTKAKRRTIVREKPGISPLLLGKMLLSNSVFMWLSDCMEHLQPFEEDVIELTMHPDMAFLYGQFEETIKEALRQALVRWDNFLLGAYLHALFSYPERIYKGVHVIDPADGRRRSPTLRSRKASLTRCLGRGQAGSGTVWDVLILQRLTRPRGCAFTLGPAFSLNQF